MVFAREAEAAVADLNNAEWCGRCIHVERGRPRPAGPPGKRAPLRELG
jgi:hypothetical protein